MVDVVFDARRKRELTPEEVSALPKPSRPALAVRKQRLRDQVNTIKRDRQNGTAVTSQGTVDSDPESRNKLNGAVLMAMLSIQNSQSFSIDWTLSDNSSVTLNAPAMIAMASEVGTHVATQHAYAKALKDAIEVAADHAALDAIDIQTGWPG